MKIKFESSRLGRALRRLAGEEKGAVMMEYVVLAVLLVAAVVGAVMAFSGRISNQFRAAGEAAGGQTTTAGNTVSTANGDFNTAMQDAVRAGNTINGGEFNNQAR